MNNYYVYRHIRVDKNEPFYIGIGTKSITKFNSNKKIYSRAYSKVGRSNWWKKVTNKTEYEVEILLESDDYDFIKQKEIEFIALYGRRDLGKGTLVNLTDGGEGSKGRVITETVKGKFKFGKNPMAKKVINKNTLEVFDSAKEAYKNINGIELYSFYKMLAGTLKNKTCFEYLHKSDLQKGREVIDIITKVIYKSIREAAIKNNILVDTLVSLLKNDYYNHTNLRYLDEYEDGIDNTKKYPYVKIINIETKEVYKTLREASKISGICYTCLSQKLNGNCYNDTVYQKLEDYNKGLLINWNYKNTINKEIAFE